MKLAIKNLLCLVFGHQWWVPRFDLCPGWTTGDILEKHCLRCEKKKPLAWCMVGNERIFFDSGPIKDMGQKLVIIA